MTAIVAYFESETSPRGGRILLVPIAAAFLLGPYGVMLGGGPTGVGPWILTALAVLVGALLAGVGIAQPRRSIAIDGDTRTIQITETAPLPRPGVVHRTIAFDTVIGTSYEEVGALRSKFHGFRPVVELEGDRRLALKRRPNAEWAQDVIDHLVLLGLPGDSRAAQRAAQLDAAPPVTWL